MRASLEGTVALVTGASSGIGEATAIALATQGATVSLVGRRKDRLEDLAARIRARKSEALVADADIAVEDEARRVVDHTVDELGRLDTLVNCAGVMICGRSLDDWQWMVRVNLMGLLSCTHAALPHLERAAEAGPRQVADVVNIGSTLGRFPGAHKAVYAATKASVAAFSEAMRQEVGDRHVRVSVVEPGAVNTELHVHPGLTADGRTPLRPEDVADAVAYIVTRPRRVALCEIVLRPLEGAA